MSASQSTHNSNMQYQAGFNDKDIVYEEELHGAQIYSKMKNREHAVELASASTNTHETDTC